MLCPKLDVKWVSVTGKLGWGINGVREEEEAGAGGDVVGEVFL